MRHSIVVSLFLSLLAVNSFSQKTTDKPKPPASQAPVPSAPADSSNRLPVKRVVLYKNGMGYFEHTAQVAARRTSASTSQPRSSTMR